MQPASGGCRPWSVPPQPLPPLHQEIFTACIPLLGAVYKKLQRLHVVPVLFVHGHLGTHQQMRSAASETGRELARRLTANASWPLWLQWYSTDFNAEASALDAALLVRHSSSQREGMAQSDCGAQR